MPIAGRKTKSRLNASSRIEMREKNLAARRTGDGVGSMVTMLEDGKNRA